VTLPLDDEIPVIVRMSVECARCGRSEDDTYEFEMPRDNSEPMEEYVPGTCPDCGAEIPMHLSRTQQRQ
jgi:DNA-directed RNA polymerase subunit RPC12/RpoP